MIQTIFYDMQTEIKVAVVVESPDKSVLLIKERTQKFPEGGWNVIKGSHEEDEALQDTIARECLEEAGIKVQLVQSLGVFFVQTSNSNKVQFNFLVVTEDEGRISSQKDQLVRNEMIEEIRWFSREELELLTEKDMLSTRAFRVVQNYLKNLAYPLACTQEIQE